jgi:hypothetical protein
MIPFPLEDFRGVMHSFQESVLGYNKVKEWLQELVANNVFRFLQMIKEIN